MATIVTKPTINKIRIAETDINRLELPEGYRLVREKTKTEKIADMKAEITRLEVEQEPSDAELIEFGKEMHPYYANRIELDWAKRNLQKLKE